MKHTKLFGTGLVSNARLNLGLAGAIQATAALLAITSSRTLDISFLLLLLVAGVGLAYAALSTSNELRDALPPGEHEHFD